MWGNHTTVHMERSDENFWESAFSLGLNPGQWTLTTRIFIYFGFLGENLTSIDQVGLAFLHLAFAFYF